MSALGGLLKWFGHHEQRSYPRKVGEFALSWSTGKAHGKGVGAEIAPNGLVFLSPDVIPGSEFNVGFRIRSRLITVRVQLQRADRHAPAKVAGAANRYACSFVGIAADDWDALQRYVNDLPEPGPNKAAAELAELAKQADDAYRSLPLAVQQRLVRFLVDANRLEQPAENQAPAIRLSILGRAKTAEGGSVLRLNIHSRKRIDGESYAFDTQFVINEQTGEVETL